MRRETRLSTLMITIVLASSLLISGTLASTQNVSSQKPAMGGMGGTGGMGGHDFSESNWNTTADFMDFLRAGHPNETELSGSHLNIYTVWVNDSSVPLQMLYLGFINFTVGSMFDMTMPMQLILEHFKSPSGSNVILASSFMMLMAFNDSTGPNIRNVPDENDTVWVSLTMGANGLIGTLNALTGNPISGIDPGVHATPLKMNVTANHYEWGMSYTNLVSLWMRLRMSDTSEGVASVLDFSPLKAISVLSELTFIYKMDIYPSTATTPGNATIRMSYRIGPFTNLWVLGLQKPINATSSYIDYYNTTKSQRLYGPASTLKGNVTDFLVSGQYKLAMTFFQKAALVSGVPSYKDDQGTDSSDRDNNVTDRRIGGYVGAEKILETAIGTSKISYQLYDRSGPHSYSSVAYTRAFHGLRDHVEFDFGVLGDVMWLGLGFAARNLEPRLPPGAVMDWGHSDYIYTVSYPMWGGYKIVHDPYFAVFTSSGAPSGALPTTYLIIAVAAIVVVIAAVVLVRRRK